ncbi:hypothetical protein SDC9_148441 [bioreactor metagenome]|uniref:Uncharacterized protein n=1 Tax=bioreactor metagenome TaxID=1076179 RepID=A0A645EGU1_9ZZZZ
MRRTKKHSMVVRRLPVAELNDIVYCTTPMPLELAETIRTLRLEHRLCYEDIMYSLCESDPDHGQCFGYGKVLVELACLRLNDYNPSWK